MSDVKIALCLSGHLRCFKEVFHSIEANLINPLKELGNLDIFGSFWKTLNTPLCHGKDHHQDLIDKLVNPQEVLDLYRPVCVEFDDFNKDNFRLSSLTDNLHGPAATTFGDFLSIIPSFYKVFRANQLKINNELKNNFKYDLVVKARPDFLFQHKMEFDLNNEFVTVMAHNPGLNDQLFYGPSHLMDQATNTFNNLRQIFTLPIDRGGEVVLEQSFLIEKLPFKLYNKAWNLYRYSG